MYKNYIVLTTKCWEKFRRSKYRYTILWIKRVTINSHQISLWIQPTFKEKSCSIFGFFCLEKETKFVGKGLEWPKESIAEAQSWKTYPPWFKYLLLKYNNQDTIVMAERYTNREKDSPEPDPHIHGPLIFHMMAKQSSIDGKSFPKSFWNNWISRWKNKAKQPKHWFFLPQIWESSQTWKCRLKPQLKYKASRQKHKRIFS